MSIATSVRPSETVIQRISDMVAVRLSFTWLGVRRTLTTDQKASAASQFDADARYLSASKKIVDTKHPAMKTLTAIKGRISDYFHNSTLPFPEPGVRLLPRGYLEDFINTMEALRNELNNAVERLEAAAFELREDARHRLGELFNPSDYPHSFRGSFLASWDFPSVEPPSYLHDLSPELFEQERRRAEARFEEAIALAESAFIDEFGKLVGHLTERLSGSDDGKPKVFRDSAVENLREFYGRFSKLNIRSNEELDQLVDQAARLTGNVSAQRLRDSSTLRQTTAEQLGVVQQQLDQLMEARPRRRLIRSTPQTQQEGPCNSSSTPSE